MYKYELMNQRKHTKISFIHCDHCAPTWHHRDFFAQDVDRVSSLIEIDQRHTVDFRIPGTCSQQHLLFNSVACLFQRMYKGRQERLSERCPLKVFGRTGCALYLHPRSFHCYFTCLFISFHTKFLHSRHIPFSFSVRCYVHCKN